MQHPTTGDVIFYTATTGVRLEHGTTLVAGTTYYASFQGAEAMWSSIQWKWDAALVITAITMESSNLSEPDLSGGNDFYGGVEIWAAAANGWSLEAAIATITAAGGTAGNSLVHIGGSGAKRMRAKVVIGATGGKLRGIPHHKS